MAESFAVAGGAATQREVLAQVRQVLRQSKLGAVNPNGLAELLRICDEVDQAARRRQAAFDRFERDAYVAAGQQVRERVYALATALGRALPDQRGLAERLVATEAQAPGGGPT
ncbi:MAG TPA: hypothetical protein VEW68_02285 [Patescibacteria group bacterium]|nr:hypothetical protein [Patescibacteria group bacterium]